MNHFIFSNNKKTVLSLLLLICLSFPAVLSAQGTQSSSGTQTGQTSTYSAIFNSGTLNSFNSQFLPSGLKAQYNALSPQQQDQFRTAMYQAYLDEQASQSVQLPSSSSLESPDDDIFIYVPPSGQSGAGTQLPGSSAQGAFQPSDISTPGSPNPGGGGWWNNLNTWLFGSSNNTVTNATIGVCTPSPGGGIVPCNGTDRKCDFTQLLCLARNIINFLIVASTSLAVISFIYAGFLYLTAGGNESKIKDAHKIFWMVLIGFVVVLVAWVLVNTIVSALLNPGYSFLG
jgi:hypothetical protein